MRHWMPCALLLTSVSLVPTVRAQTFGELIPEDVKMVVVTANITKAHQNAEAFAKAIGLGIPPQFSPDGLANLTGLGDTWAVDKGAALVLLNFGDKETATIFPVTSAKAALAKLEAGDEEDGHYNVKFPPGKEAFALAKGKHLVIAPKPEVLDAFRNPAETLGKEFSEGTAETDAYLYVNVAGVRPMLEQVMPGIEQQISNLPLPAGQANPEITRGFLRWYAAQIANLVKETDGAYVSLSLSETDVHVDTTLAFADGSYCAKTLGNLGTAEEPLANLPDLPLLMAFGIQGKGVMKVMADVTESMLAIPELAESMTAERRDEVLTSVKKLYRQLDGMNMVMSTGKSGINSAGTYLTDNPEKLQQLLRTMMVDLKELLAAFAPGMTEPVRREVKGLEVDEVAMDLSKLPAVQRQMLQSMYGPGFKTQSAVINDQFAFAQGSGDPILLHRAKEKLADNERVAGVVEDLAEDAAGVVLVDVFNYASLVRSAMANGPVPVALPEFAIPKELPPPIGFSISGAEGDLNLETLVRTETISAVIKSVQATLAQPRP